ncbi:balbiani ring protein 3-like [Frankliniella occidentalis]|uniref:Balbiani ring protein 3-like n=1 Tax=Frankliniella occidentalis TaxID=133901 RepID=A0A9C6X0J1_FRAOC|nr:balbiani ring protein 3-like [Frankliniella occidentalis]
MRFAMLTAPMLLVLALHVSVLTASATEDKQKYDKCVADQKCETSPASCSSWDGKDFTALAICRLNCHCTCLSPAGPTGALDSFKKWEMCSEDNKCEKTHDDCKKKCSNKECKDACVLAQDKCMCECNRA